MKTLLRAARATPFLLLLFCTAIQAQTTGYSGTGNNIDVKYHRFEWTLNPAAAKNIAGTVTTYFKTTQANVSNISFDFAKVSFDNRDLIVKYHGSTAGVVVTWPTSGNTNILKIKLPVTLAVNTLDSVSISYSGAPPDFSTYGEGFDKQNITGLGVALYTLAESYGDDDFWPCKADMQDKIDSVDFIITTPSAYRAAANGKLISDFISGTNRIMTYKHRYPIASYLVAVAVADYIVYNRAPVNISGTSVPITYFIGSGRTPTTTQLNTMDYCRDQLVAFSNKFGDYPFKNEKYGMYEFGWGGGMEHQTFSAMGWSAMNSWSVIAHELAHQWFGDKVTFATWNHLWLAEGFAKYSEVLAAELVTSMGKDPVSHRTSIKATALSTTTTPIYLSQASIANSNTIWTTPNNNTLYQRGAMVVSMLRKLAGDAKFFQALKNYLADPALAYKSATTENLRDHFEAVLGYDLDSFFQDYIYGTGNPAYDIKWGSAANSKSINIELTSQRRSASSTVPYFRTPVVLKISGSTKDTTVVIYDENGKVSYAGNGIRQSHTGNVLGYNLSFVPTSVTVDPNAETLVRGQETAPFGTSWIAASTIGKVTRLNTPPIYVLPISIIDFKGTNTANGNALSLLIASSDEKITIEAERSTNGTSFSSIGTMIKSTSAESGVLYLLMDRNIGTENLFFYRAKTVDEKGIVKYSKVISLKKERLSEGVSINPNPVIDHINVVLSNGWEQGRVGITLFNDAGVTVKREQVNGAPRMQLPVSHLPAGNYRLEVVQQGGKTINKRFLIVR